MKGEWIVRVDAPHFCAGFILKDGRVTEAAPILAWTVGRDPDYLRGYFKRKGWKATILPELR